jgi:3'-phosphoadenosine 5'-phosphosulfate sulfotransferase (PAPS reductase)/FAD synthetase
MEYRHTMEDLKFLQSMPLEMKIQKSIAKIMEWYTRHDGLVSVSFSGGKDSTVLLHLVRQIFPDVPAVFVNTGLEYPELVAHVKSFENVTILRPALNFRGVIEKYGYPIISKDVARVIEQYRKGSKYAEAQLAGINPDGSASVFRQRYCKWKYLTDAPFKISDGCCYAMKEAPLRKYMSETKRKPIVGTLATESKRRMNGWMKVGCNSFEGRKARSAPLSFWTEDDVLLYIRAHKLPIASVYGEVVRTKQGYRTTGTDRTGCMFCLFACHLEKPTNRIQRMAETHPKLYEYCLRDWDAGGLGLRKVMEHIGIPYKPRKKKGANNENRTPEN